MSETKAKAETATKEIEEVAAVVLPEPANALVVIEEMKPNEKKAITQRMKEIDISSTQSIIAFGSNASCHPSAAFPLMN